MTTETDLRSALHTRAHAAAPFDVDLFLTQLGVSEPAGGFWAQPGRPRQLAVVGVAAGLVALAASPVVVARGSGHHGGSDTNLAGATTGTPTTAPPSTSADPPVTDVPTSNPPPSTVYPTPVLTTESVGPGPTSGSPVVNPFVVVYSTDGISAFDPGPDVETTTLEIPAGPDQTTDVSSHTTVSAYATGGFDPSTRVAGATIVVVNGITMLFGSVSVWPADGRPDPATGKQDAAAPSLVWQVGTHWVVLQTDRAAVPSLADLSAADQRLTVGLPGK